MSIAASAAQFMGLHGIENSQTLYADVYVPAGNVIGREGIGLKIALLPQQSPGARQ